MIRKASASLLLLLLVAATAWGRESAPEDKPADKPALRVCTDLSGKFKVPCPEDWKAAPSPQSASGPASAAAAPKATTGEPIRVFRPAAVESGKTATPAQPVATVPVQTNPPAGAPSLPVTKSVKPVSAGEPIKVFRPAPWESGKTTSTAQPVSTAGPASPPAGEPLAPLTKRATSASDAESAAWVRKSPFAFSYGGASLRRLPQNLLIDQKNFWTSPARMRVRDVFLLAPFVGATAGLLAYDTNIEKRLPTNPTLIKRSKDFGTYGAAAFAGVTGGAFLLGKLTDNDHMAETGLLSGEAAVSSIIPVELLKVSTGRQRPLEGNGQGNFRAGGVSFPSEHSAAAWSIATVIAHEYPGPLMQLLAYGGAGAMTASRVLGRQHFSSDALVGSAVGWFIGRQVYRAHNAANVEDAARYGTFEREVRPDRPGTPANMGSPYVPLESWVYSAMDRLSALGYLPSSFAGLRPWTRQECLRLLDEATLQLQSEADSSGDEAAHLLRALQVEFALENDRVASGSNLGAEVESIYTRVTGISGPPLTDGYHFGQTIINDYGRPYQQGANLVMGISGHAEAGPAVFYVRGEYQHAPSAPALSQTTRQTTALVDGMPFISPALPTPSVDQLRLLDAYVAVNLNNWEVSLGKQTLWWGPGNGGPMMFSNNIEPISMLRFNRVTPFQLPSVFSLLGPVRTEVFLGRLSGFEFIDTPSGLVGQYGRALPSQPFIHGQKISFKPTPNFEFGFFRTTIYGGTGYPFTAHTFVRSLFSTGNETEGAINKPGDRRSGLDFSYRIPKLRNWLTLYGDGFTDDEYSPVAYFDRSAWHAGLYLPRLPAVPKLDLRVEGVYTDNPIGGNVGPGFYYQNGTWRTGYRNDGNLIGSWIGRGGQGAQAWTSYHFSPHSFFELGYRHQKVSREFAGGGTLSDFSATADILVRRDVSLRGWVQYERWIFPALQPLPQTDVVASFQLTFRPAWRLGR